ncbi:hypothetical protein ACTWQL_14735 [Pseudalkalibacillus sp. R45]|uniref:hypothetical protein n=1 Tax=Pseudalkalibacillus sp. R45 TaxID=3457433 RepID=UPI003FCD8695
MRKKGLFNEGETVRHTKKKNKCKSCLCDLLRDLEKGTLIRLAFLEDFFEEDQEYRFVSFDKETCCVTLIDPSDDNAFVLDCNELVAFEIVNVNGPGAVE